ncbi:hypothetical protein KP509_20G014800 [Ceratopteris richardii]|uniref:NAC domain-containing protein n=1 Tax=Ceratopteris richardii TaxID=49495 RepID=A0A8T2SDZ1_CERRI|nr:hypothetical protein KP509_20G014800 [Ceratopteris richardii]
MRAELGKDPTRAPRSQLNLPAGFRFYPTDEELVVHYLCKKAAGEPFDVPIIAEVELYKYNPWELPDKALFGEREWYFFSPRDRKYPNGSRPNRAAGTGYWKATGTDKPIDAIGGAKKVGVKKALVFYHGKPPNGVKTNWIMHEYRLVDSGGPRIPAKRKGSLRLDDWVLCRIYKKSSSAENQMNSASGARTDFKCEQSESSCIDEVLANLTDDPTDAAPKEPAKKKCKGMEVHNAAAETRRSLDHSYQCNSASEYSPQKELTDIRDYMKELHERVELTTRNEAGIWTAGVGLNLRDGAATSDSNVSSRQLSPLASSNSHQQEEEDPTVESTFNALTGFPFTQLLNTQNGGVFGLDLGLPSPCTMLAQGASFRGNLTDPEGYFCQPSGWDSTRLNFSG